MPQVDTTSSKVNVDEEPKSKTELFNRIKQVHELRRKAEKCAGSSMEVSLWMQCAKDSLNLSCELEDAMAKRDGPNYTKKEAEYRKHAVDLLNLSLSALDSIANIFEKLKNPKMTALWLKCGAVVRMRRFLLNRQKVSAGITKSDRFLRSRNAPVPNSVVNTVTTQSSPINNETTSPSALHRSQSAVESPSPPPVVIPTNQVTQDTSVLNQQFIDTQSELNVELSGILKMSNSMTKAEALEKEVYPPVNYSHIHVHANPKEVIEFALKESEADKLGALSS